MFGSGSKEKIKGVIGENKTSAQKHFEGMHSLHPLKVVSTEAKNYFFFFFLALLLAFFLGFAFALVFFFLAARFFAGI